MKRFLPIAAVLLATACTPTSAYVQADRATYNVVAPSWRAYTAADNNLTPEQKQARYDLLWSWAVRVGAEQQVAPPPTEPTP